MTFFFRTYATPLVLLLALFICSATASSTFAQDEPVAPVQCCDKEAAPEIPSEEGECSECGCLSCSAALEANSYIRHVVISPVATPQGWLSQEHPSDYIRSIDYPPELV